MFIKKDIITLALIIATFIVLVGIYFYCSKSPDVALIKSELNGAVKYVGSEDGDVFLTRAKYRDLKSLASFADLIVIGKIDKKPTADEFQMIVASPETEARFGKHIREVSVNKVKVKEVIYGNETSDEITLLQLGHPDSDRNETKVKKNKETIMLLREIDFKGEKAYMSVSFELGFFDIDTDTDTVMSYDNKEVVAIYDENSKHEFLNELKKIKNETESLTLEQKRNDLYQYNENLFNANNSDIQLINEVESQEEIYNDDVNNELKNQVEFYNIESDNNINLDNEVFIN